jgi:hypothetical protein
LTLLDPGVQGATIHVPADAPTIQAGLDFASPGDTLVVACGIYYEHELRIDRSIVVTSETGNAECVTIDAQDQGRVFRAEFVTGPIRLEGLTIKNGVTEENEFGTLDDTGGGIYLDQCSDFTITRSIIEQNTARWRGGGLASYFSHVTIVECLITENQATYADYSSGTAGGGVFGESGSLKLLDTVVANNLAGTWLAGGGGVFWIITGVEITRCVFDGNISSTRGGGLAVGAGGQIRDSIFNNNVAADEPGGGIQAGGSLAILSITNCLFTQNSAPVGAAVSARRLVMDGCTLTKNLGGGITFSLPGSFVQQISNTIVANNQGHAVYYFGSLEHSIICTNIYGNSTNWYGPIQESADMNGNISEDPLFCDFDNGNYYLYSNSPCAPANSNGCGLIGLYDVACEPTSVEAASWGKIKAGYR